MKKFWDKVNKTDGCWNWNGYIDNRGYGLFYLGKYQRPAHRIAYELVKGEIPEGLVIDHLCRNRSCVNPDHLEPVTIGENVMRGESIAAVNSRSSHCPNGHEYTEENTYFYKGTRNCKTCKYARRREWYARKRKKEIV